jgi:hypothetical protein
MKIPSTSTSSLKQGIPKTLWKVMDKNGTFQKGYDEIARVVVDHYTNPRQHNII